MRCRFASRKERRDHEPRPRRGLFLRVRRRDGAGRRGPGGGSTGWTASTIRASSKAMHHLRMQESGRGNSCARTCNGWWRCRACSGAGRKIGGERGHPDLVARLAGVEREGARRSPSSGSWTSGRRRSSRGTGSGSTCPILVYRALHHGVSAGPLLRDPRSRTSVSTTTSTGTTSGTRILMDVFASAPAPGRRSRSRSSPDSSACPASRRDEAARTWRGRYFAGEIDAIRDYCEADALLIWLIYLRFDRLRGRLDDAGLADELALVREAVRDRRHLQAFAGVGEPG